MVENMNNQESWFPLILVAFASFIITLDTTFMNVSISNLIVDLNTTIGTVQGIICFYTLITASLMLVGSKFQDIFGKRRIFLTGAFIYGLGALIASLSINSTMLFIGWSLLEGIGGALMTPSTISIISGSYNGEKRTFALAISSAIVGIAAAIGPLFGGVVTSFLSWRFGFVFELIIILFIFIFYKKIPVFIKTEKLADFDIIGAILSVTGIILFVLGVLTLISDRIKSLALMICGLILILVFILFENKRKSNNKIPLFDVSLLKEKNLSLGMIIRLITNLSIAGSLFAVSLFLQSVLKLNAFNTGLNLLPLTISLLIFSLLAPKLAVKFNHKYIMVLGFIISIIGVLAFKSRFTLDTKFSDLFLGLIIFGAGLGLIISLSVDISLRNTPPKSQSTASGFITTGQTLGSSMGTAIIGCILIIGAIGGLHDATNTYAPNHISDSEFKSNLHVYFEKLGHVNGKEIKEKPIIKKIVNLVIKDAMKLVMNFTILLLSIGLILTLFLDDTKIKRKNKLFNNNHIN